MKAHLSFETEEGFEYFFNPNDAIFHMMVGISNPDPHYEIQRQPSSCFSIEYIISGEGVIQEDDKLSKVVADDLYIMHPNKYSHYYSNPKNPFKKIWIVFDCDYTFIENLLKAYKVSDVFVLHNVNMYEEFYDIFKFLQDEPPNLPYLVENALLKLVRKIQDRANYSLNDNTEKIAVLGKKYIDRKINYHIKIEEVYKYVNSSRTQFFKAFKQEYNISPAEYILRSKIDAAKLLLSHSDYPIGEIAMRFDFANFPHFSYTFKKYVGCSPSEYREQNRTNDGAFKSN